MRTEHARDVIFENVWQVQDLKSRVFGCVAGKGLTSGNLGCMANEGLSEKPVVSGGQMARKAGWDGAIEGWRATFTNHDSMPVN